MTLGPSPESAAAGTACVSTGAGSAAFVAQAESAQDATTAQANPRARRSNVSNGG
jgi:hypothetical protein